MRAAIAFCLVLLAAGRANTQGVSSMRHPETLAGRWESPDDHGGEVGMNILVLTTVPSSITTLVDVPQTLQQLEIGLYQRSGSDVALLGFNFFTTSSNHAATWDGRRLLIDLQQTAALPKVHVDLAWNNSAQTWTGTFERGSFHTSSITLKRPTGPQNSPFLGTWFEPTGSMNNCLHISAARDGTLTGWSDDIQIPGRLRYGHGLRPPERTPQDYGEIARVTQAAPDRIEVELRAYTAICCSHPFTAILSRDHNSLIADWPPQPRQAIGPAHWIRIKGDSCVPAASHR